MSYQNLKFQAIDAYALMGDVSGMAEKMQSFFLQEVLSQTHAVLRDVLHEVQL
jgi:syndetin